MSAAWWAYGSDLKIGDDGTSESFTKIVEIIDINGPNMSHDVIEVTNQDSTNGWREFLPGLRDGGEVSVTANWYPAHATQDGTEGAAGTGLLSKFTDDDLHNFQIVTEDDGTGGTLTIEFAAVVTNFSIALPLEEQAKLDFTLKMSGAPTFS
jgi:predicted secreted protein